MTDNKNQLDWPRLHSHILFNVKSSFVIKRQLEDLIGLDHKVLIRRRLKPSYRLRLTSMSPIVVIRSFDPGISTTVQGRELRLGLSGDTKKTVFRCTISNLLYYEWFHTIEVTLNP